MKNLSSKGKKFGSLFASVVIPLCILFCVALYVFVLGDSSNFQDGDPVKGHPKNYLGIIHKGGYVVPVLMSFFLMVVTFSIERMITITRAYGKGSLDRFLGNVKGNLSKNEIDNSIDHCLDQKGSVGNVVYSVLTKFREVWNDDSLSKDQKAAVLQKETEESTALELPMLEKNLTVIATLASVATLVGLLGTVIGMIKAFAALANAGAPDASALATGISEALINTALGIASSALAIISYNYFTSKIDVLTYSIDEIGYSIVQHFNATYREKSEKKAVAKELVA